MREIFPNEYVNNTEAQKIALLKELARELIDDHVSIQEALPQLREQKDLIQSSCRDSELSQFLQAVKRKKVSLDQLIKPGGKLKLTSEPFILNGVIISGGTNLIVGREKKGKSAFVAAMVGAWSHGQEQFCGFDFVGPCPPVAIIGPDMSEAQWGKMLHSYHLADEEGNLPDDSPIKYLLHMGHGLSLDQHGLDLIDQIAEDLCNRFPDQQPLLIFDAYARLVDDLGLQEATSEFATPMSSAQALLRKYKVTDVWLHHSAANRETGKATSRGSTALPALADQQIFMEYPTANEDDPRTALRTKGRDVPVRALLERTKPDGVWVVHASGDEVEAQKQIQERIEKLKEGTQPRDCFNAMQTLHPANPGGVDLWQIAEVLGIDKSETLRKPINRLKDLCLISSYSSGASAADGGRPREKYKFLESVRKLLGPEFTVRKPPLALGEKVERSEREETPDTNASDTALAYGEKSLNVSKPLLLNTQEVYGQSGRADAVPSLNGSTSAVNALISANPKLHHSTLANRISAELGVDLNGAEVKAIRESLALPRVTSEQGSLAEFDF
ncbi:AAA family ATPase [Synechococcus sp. AH-224-I15]|nr:AAA family ATPase [Synechococcus sp. AH-224-I15]